MSLILSGTDGLSDVDGSAATPAIRGTDANTGIFFPAADTIAFAEGGVEAMRINSSGNLGLGVTPSAWDTVVPAFQIGGAGGYIAAQGSAEVLRIGSNNYYGSSAFRYVINGNASRYDQTSGVHSWHTAPSGTAGNAITFTQAMTLDASGNLGVGTASPSGASGTTIALNGKAGQARIAIKNDSTGDAAGDGFQIGLDTSGLGCFIEQRENAEMRFSTNAVERARIDSSGNFMVGTTSAGAGASWAPKLTVDAGAGYGAMFKSGASGSGYECIDCWNIATSGSNNLINFYTDSGASYRGGIFYNRPSGVIAYATTSDYRSKDIIGPVNNALGTVTQLKPYMGLMKGATVERPMFVAHEAQVVTPYAVMGEKDAIDEEGSPVYQQMDHAVLVPLLTAAIQEQQAIIESLKARLDAANL